MPKPKNIDEYISGYPEDVQAMLQQLRAIIIKAAPAAKEIISYSMPAFKTEKMLVYFAAHTSHVGFYPFRSAIIAFKKELSVYKTAVGSVQFPFGKPLPVKLISNMVKFRVRENAEKAALTKAAKKKPVTKAAKAK